MSADEARKQSTHHAFSGDYQFFFGVGGGAAGLRLRESSIVLSTETGTKFWCSLLEVSPVVDCGWPFFRAHAQDETILKQTKTELTSDTVQLRHTGVTTQSRVL